jgi:ubiquinol-cytochrome c reductase iron-sulfur subunit
VPATSAPQKLDELGSIDHEFTNYQVDRVAEPERRAFTYLMLSSVHFAYASMARLLVVKFVASMSPSAEVLALAFAEFDLSALEVGKSMLVDWRGKPIYIRRRTPAEIEDMANVPMAHLRDQETDDERTLKSDLIVVIGICPHLGCVPLPNAGDFDGFFCPCHGSHYDVSGRIRLGPAPLNLEVPPYKFTEGTEIIVLG